MGLAIAIVTKQYFMPIMVDMLEWCTVKSGHHLSFYFLPLTADWLPLTALVLIISYNDNCFLYKHIAVLSPDQMIYTSTLSDASLGCFDVRNTILKSLS